MLVDSLLLRATSSPKQTTTDNDAVVAAAAAADNAAADADDEELVQALADEQPLLAAASADAAPHKPATPSPETTLLSPRSALGAGLSPRRGGVVVSLSHAHTPTLDAQRPCECERWLAAQRTASPSLSAARCWCAARRRARRARARARLTARAARAELGRQREWPTGRRRSRRSASADAARHDARRRASAARCTGFRVDWPLTRTCVCVDRPFAWRAARDTRRLSRRAVVSTRGATTRAVS